MAKGFFTQGVSLLTDGQTTIDKVKSALQEHGFEVVREMPPQDDWCFGGPTVIVPFLPEVNGYVAVDVVNQPWPDSMGDPKTDAMPFGAWSMGYFGPFAFPRSLARACLQAWAWKPGRTVLVDHRGFIRIRTSYVFGAGDNVQMLPERYDPLAEMMFLSRVVLAVFGVPGVICYFNPNGETLFDLRTFRTIWEACRIEKKIPLPLWMNVRFYNINEQFEFMDTVGNGQLEIADVEAIFSQPKYEPNDVDYYLRNVTHYLFESGNAIRTGDAIDGPGDSDLSWIAEMHEEKLIYPPRRVLRVYPKADVEAVHRTLTAMERSAP